MSNVVRYSTLKAPHYALPLLRHDDAANRKHGGVQLSGHASTSKYLM